MNEDWQQLEVYVTRQSGANEAFAAIVNRYINLVFSAALRQVNDRSAAEEVTQAVFILLAKKAPKLKPTGSLGGWLYNAASLKAKEHLRSDLARRKREQKAYDMSNSDSQNQADDDGLDWERVAPLLDTAMGDLPDGDREAVLMRYFQNRPLREVAESLGVSEDAARKRVSRAVDRLRGWFADRGVAFSAVALTAGLTTRAVEAAPANLAVTTLQTIAAQTAVTTSTSSILTTMASTKFTAVAAVLIGAAIPISLAYVKPEPLAEVPTPAPPVRVAPVFEIPQPDESELIAEWKRLRSEYGPDLGSMPELYAAVKGIKDDFRRRAFRGALIAEWATLDGAGALAFLLKNDKGMIGQLMSDWLDYDPQAAIAALEAGGSSMKNQIKSKLGRIAEISPQSLAVLAVHVERRSPWNNHVKDAFATFARKDLAAARTMAEGMGGAAGAEALAGIAAVWGERDGSAAFDWVQAIEDDLGRGRAMEGLLVGWAKSDPLAALERIDLAPPGGDRNSTHNAAAQVVAAAAEADFDLVVDWLAKQKETDHLQRNSSDGISGALRKRFMGDVVGTLEYIRDSPAQEPLRQALHGHLLNDGYAERQVVWDWMMQQPEGEFSTELRNSLLRSAGWKEPQQAIEWYRTLPEGTENGNQRWGFASALLNGGNDRGRLDGLLEQVTEPQLRIDLMNVVLSNPGTTLDGPVWAARLGEFPEAERSAAAGKIASGWSLQDPEGAIGFARGLGREEERSAAFNGLVEVWARADSFEASEWIAGLEEGPERGAAIEGLVRSIGSSDPESAWEWAQAATVPEQRQNAIAAAIRGLIDSDVNLAQARLDQSPELSADSQKELRDQIEFKRSKK